MKSVRVEVNDKMQKGYVYLRTKPMGRSFSAGFNPQLTPKQMLELGVFGGKYMTDCRKEFPASWFKRARLSQDRRPRILELFWRQRFATSRGLAKEKAGFIRMIRADGFNGIAAITRTTLPDDLRQIKRWRAIRRHVAQLKKNCRPRDLDCRRRQRQAFFIGPMIHAKSSEP